MMFWGRNSVSHCCNTVVFMLVVLFLMEAFNSTKATATTNQVHNYNDTCTQLWPQEQCITNNSHCLEYNNGGYFKCQCDKWDYKDKHEDICLPRPILHDITIGSSKSGNTPNSLLIGWSGGTYKENTMAVIVIQPPDKNGQTTFNKPWDDFSRYFVIGMLPSGTNFDIRFYIEQNGVRSGNYSYNSAYTKPEPPINLALTNIWERNLTVTWQTSTDGKCDNYTLTIGPAPEYGNGTVVIPCSNDTTSHIFNNLEGGTEYTVLMESHVPGYTSENNPELKKYTRPKPVSRAYIQKQHERSLTLYMESDTTKDRYCLNVSPSASGNEPETEVFAYNDTYDLTNLKAGTLYTIKIYTYLQGRKSETFVQLENFTRPEAPKTVKFSKIEETSFDMTWSIDEIQILEEFIVSIDPQSSDFPMDIPSSNETVYNLTVNKLREGKQYTVHICTKINDTRSENCAFNKTYTRPVLKDTTVGVSKLRTTADSLVIGWKGASTYTEDTMVVLVIQPPDKTGQTTFEKMWEEFSTSLVIDLLPSGTNFDIRLYIQVNDVLSGNYSYVSAYTKPDPPINLALAYIWEQNLIVTWQKDLDGKCDNYTLTIVPTPEYGSGTVVISCSNDTTSYIFNNLEGGTEYTITMESHVPGYTSENNPVLKNYTRPKPVSRAYIQEQHEHSLLLYMESSTTKERYCLNVIPSVSGDESQTEVFAYNDTYDLTDLKAGTLYSIKIYTYLQGRKSETFVQLENFTRPERPKTIQFSNIKETSYDMTWSIDESQILNEFVVSIDPQTSDFPVYIPRSKRIEYNLTVEQLQEGTQYTVHICTKINDTQSENCIINKTFTRPLLPSSVEIRTQLQTSIIVQFPADDHRMFDKYLVTIEDKFGQQETRLVDRSAIDTQGPTISSISGLIAETSYTFVVFTAIGDLQLQSSGNITIAASTAESPLPTGTVPLELIHERNLTVFWQSVGGVDMYKAMLKSADDSDMFNKTWDVGKDFNNYTFVGLTPGILYDGAIVLVWNGLKININITLPLIYTRPAPPSTVTYTVEETSITITDIDRTWHQYVLSFDLLLNNNKIKTNIHWNVTSLLQPITGLSVGTIYTITIYSIVGTIQAEYPYVLHMNTKPGPVSNILPVIPEFTTSTMKIQWVKPEGNISFYHVEFTCTSPNGNGSISTHTYTTTNNSATMSGLDPGTFCSVTVQSTLGNQNGLTINNNISISTNETVPGIPVESRITSYTYNTVDLSWKPPVERNGVITAYTIRYIFYKKLCQNGITVEGEEETVIKNVLVDMIRPTEMIINDGIYSYWNYTFSITANTSVGEGSPFTFNPIKTLGSKPSQIETVNTNTTAYAVNIHWSLPCFPNGILTNYKVCLTNISKDADHAATCYASNSDETETTRSVLPFRNYTVKVAAETSDGQGQFSNKTYIGIPIAAPAKPQGLRASSSATDITVRWDKPALDMFTGPTQYRIIAVDTYNGSVYKCETHIATWIDTLASSCIVRGLHPYTNYTFKVTAITGIFMTASTVDIAQTEESTPGDVTGLTIQAESDVTKPRTISVSWGEPAYRDRNGILTNYFVQYTDMNEVSLTSETNNKATEFLITNIQPGIYSIKVFAATRIGNGAEVSNSTRVDPGAPIKSVESSGTLLMQPASTSVSDDQKQIAVKLPLTRFLCNKSNGEPTKWGVIVSQENEATDPPFVGSLSDFQNKIKQQYKNWFDVKDSDSIKPYIATRENWKPNCPGQNGRRRRRSADSAVTEDYEIGSDGECPGIPHDKYCNGELQPGRQYRVKTFTCTSGGCTETEYSESIATGSSDTLMPVIVGVVSAIVVITMVAGLLIYRYTRRRKKKNNRPNLRTGESETGQNGPYMELDDVTRVNDYDKIRINVNDSSRNTYLELNRPQSDVHVYEQAGVQGKGITKPDDRLSNLKVHTYTTLAKILERLTPEDDDITWWSYILHNYDLDISRKEMKQLEHSNQPGMHLMDLLDEREYTQSNIEEMFINLGMRDALHVLRNY